MARIDDDGKQKKKTMKKYTYIKEEIPRTLAVEFRSTVTIIAITFLYFISFC